MMAFRLWLVWVVAALCSGCVETNRQQFERLAPAYQVKREQLRRAAALLPPAGSVGQDELPQGLSPPLVVDEDRNSSTAEVLMDAHLLDPEQDPEIDHWIYPHSLLLCLGWTGAASPLAESARDNTADDGCVRALRFPYLVVLRTVSYRVPEEAVVEAHIVDLRQNLLRGSFRVEVTTPYDVEDLGRGPWAEEAQRRAKSMFYSKVRCAIERRLVEIPGTVLRVGGRCVASPSEGRSLTVDELFQ